MIKASMIDAAKAVRPVLRLICVSLADRLQAVLTDFAYNARAGNLDGSTLRRTINRGGRAGLPEQLMRWVQCRDEEIGSAGC